MSHFGFKASDLAEENQIDGRLIPKIQSWMQQEPALPQLCKEMICLFLLSCDNHLDRTKETIRSYYRIKNANPDIFDDRDVQRADLTKCLNTIYCISMPKRTPDDHVIHYLKLRDQYYGHFDLLPSMKLTFMLLDVSQQLTPPKKLVVLMDMEGFGLMHLTKIKIGACRTFLQFVQEAMPLKIHSVHILNAGMIFQKLLNMIKCFIKGELMSIIHTHSSGIDMEEFFLKCIPKDCMPTDYGGTLAPLELLQEKNIERLMQRQDYFDYEEAIRKKCTC